MAQLPSSSVKARENVKQYISREGHWTTEQAERLQAQIDELFGDGQAELLGLDYSFSIADPLVEGCPMVGCSSGFTELVGYELEDIIGRNCRFLAESVPKEQCKESNRKHARDFCAAVARGQDYCIPKEEQEAWMPQEQPGDAILCFQRTARKTGELFWNMFYLKSFQLGTNLDELHPYIIALQSELPNGSCTAAELAKNLHLLETRMTQVTRTLAKLFFVETKMRRHADLDDNDGFHL
jgi:hypothetical protein